MLVLIYFLGFKNSLTYGVLWGLLVLGLIGAFFVYKRRMNPPSVCPRDCGVRCPTACLRLDSGFGINGCRGQCSRALALIATVLAVIGVREIAGGALLSRPLKHLLSGSVHLAFHPRQSRFDSVGNLSTDLRLWILKRINMASARYRISNGTDCSALMPALSAENVRRLARPTLRANR